MNIFWAGDSTVQTNNILTYPQTGIGQVFFQYLRDGVTVVNFAKNGRSTKSFIDEGRLEKIDKAIKPGDFLFIQFGHNDEKEQDPKRYTEPFSSYINNLVIFIETAKKHNATPVLITPLERRCFVDERHLGMGAHSDYVAAMKQTAKKHKTALVDLYSLSRAELKKAGFAGSKTWYMQLKSGEFPMYPMGKEDNTHLRYEGAIKFAGLIAYGLWDLGGDYRKLLLEDLSFSNGVL